MHRGWACWWRSVSIDASLIKADVDKKKRLSGDQPIAWPKSEEASHAVREYLAALDAARSEDEGDSNRSNSGARGGKPPKQVSLTDPQAAWVTRKGIDPFFAYDANYLIDNKVGIILDAEGTRANRKEIVQPERVAVAQRGVQRCQVHRMAKDIRSGRRRGYWRRRHHHAVRRSVHPATRCGQAHCRAGWNSTRLLRAVCHRANTFHQGPEGEDGCHRGARWV